MVNRSRYSDRVRWLFALIITALVLAAAINPGSFNLPTPRQPQPQQGTSRVYAQDIYVAPNQVSASQPLSVTISGQVQDAVSHAGLPATVYFDPFYVNTDQNGNYSIQLDPGTYAVRAIPNEHCLGTNDLGNQNISGNATINFPINRKTDAFGHLCSTETANWIPGDTLIQLDSNGYYSTTLPSNFGFTFFGAGNPDDNQVNIYRYGFLNFGHRHDTGQFANNQIPNTSPPDNAIYAWWNDLTIDVTSTLYTKLDTSDPTHRKFIVEWRNVKLPDPDPSRVSFEIVIQEGTISGTSGNIWLNYQSTGCAAPDTCPFSHGRLATVGIESTPDQVSNTNDGIQYSYQEGVLFDNKSTHFYLPPQGIVHGRVTDKHTPLDDPMAASVQILGTSRLYNTTASAGGYYTLSVGYGTYVVQASANRYQTLTQTVTLDSVHTSVTATFDLGSPVVDPVQPGYTDMWVYAGQTKTYPLSVNNDGELDMPWVLREALDNNGGGLSAGRQLPGWAAGSRSDTSTEPQKAPANLDCSHSDFTIQRSERSYEGPNVSLHPGNNLHIDYTMQNHPIGASPAISPAHILLYSDDNGSIYHDPNGGDPPATQLGFQLPVRALCTLGYNASTTGFYNDAAGFWSALINPPGGVHWDMVIIALDSNLIFGEATPCPASGSYTHSCWSSLRSYYQGSVGVPVGKVVMNTFDVSGNLAGGNPADAADFYNNYMGAVFHGTDSGVIATPIYLWQADRSDTFYTAPYSLTSITIQQAPLFDTQIQYMDTNDIVGTCKAGILVHPTTNRCSVITTYDGRGVLSNFHLGEDSEGLNDPPPLHATKWWCNIINAVVSPPINFGDIPWISESPTSGTSLPGQHVNVTLTIDATGIATRTITPLSGYLYLGNNDPHVPRVGLAIPLSLTVILPGDPTPTPAPPPLVDLAVMSITALSATNDHPVVNQPSIISVNVSNLGGVGGTTQFSVDTFYDLQTAPPFGSHCDYINDPGCYRSVPAINAGASEVVTFTHTFTSSGVHRVWVIVNTDLTQREPTQVLYNNVGGANACVATRTGPSFTDVGTTNFSYIAVEYLVCQGIVSGLTQQQCTAVGAAFPCYTPNANTTRGQFAKMVAKGFGFPITTPATPSFTDVPPSYFAYGYIETLKAQSVVAGFTASQCVAANATPPCYLPNANITRGQLSVYIWKAKNRINPSWSTTPTGYNPHFTDVATNYFAYVAIDILTYHGVLSGFSSQQCINAHATYPCFLPNSNGTRGQLSVMLYKALTRP